MVRFSLCTLALLLLAVPSGRGQQKANESFYPLKIGSKWHYKSGEEKVVVQVAKSEVLEREIMKDNKKVKEKVAGFTLKIVSGGRELTEQVAVLPDGVYRFSTAGKEITPPLCILKFPIKKPDSWPVDSVCNEVPFKGTFTCDEADISVPAFKNTFRAVTTSFKDPKMSFEYYFAPEYGIVKQRIEVGNNKVLLELEKFEP
jgi:hypothetical protein